MKFPKWKQRAISAKADLEAAEQAARHKAFWESVGQPYRSAPLSTCECHGTEQCPSRGVDFSEMPIG